MLRPFFLLAPLLALLPHMASCADQGLLKPKEGAALYCLIIESCHECESHEAPSCQYTGYQETLWCHHTPKKGQHTLWIPLPLPHHVEDITNAPGEQAEAKGGAVTQKKGNDARKIARGCLPGKNEAHADETALVIQKPEQGADVAKLGAQADGATHKPQQHGQGGGQGGSSGKLIRQGQPKGGGSSLLSKLKNVFTGFTSPGKGLTAASKPKHPVKGRLMKEVGRGVEIDEEVEVSEDSLHGTTHMSLFHFELVMLAVLGVSLPIVYWRKIRVRHL